MGDDIYICSLFRLTRPQPGHPQRRQAARLRSPHRHPNRGDSCGFGGEGRFRLSSDGFWQNGGVLFAAVAAVVETTRRQCTQRAPRRALYIGFDFGANA